MGKRLVVTAGALLLTFGSIVVSTPSRATEGTEITVTEFAQRALEHEVPSEQDEWTPEDVEEVIESIVTEVEQQEEEQIEWLQGFASTTVNIRKDPDKKSQDLGDLHINDTVSYYQYNEEWKVIRLEDQVAFVKSEYIVDEAIDQNESLSAEEDLFARAISAEGSILGYEGMTYIGSVILNRVSSDKYPNSIKDVLNDPGQYQCVKNGAIKGEPCDTAKRVAKELLENGSVLPEEVIFQAQFKQGEGTYITVGNTYFCY